MACGSLAQLPLGEAVTSIAIKGSRYLVKPEEADKHGPFGRTFLAEGDSWMDASAWNQGSLPEFMAREYNNLGRTNLILNISTSGHTLTRIVDMMNADFAWWLDQQRYDGILFSAGGNDFIDAARDTPPGQGLLYDMHGKPVPANGYACVRQDALQQLRDYLNQNFEAIYKALRNSRNNAATTLYLNCYDTQHLRALVVHGIHEQRDRSFDLGGTDGRHLRGHQGHHPRLDHGAHGRGRGRHGRPPGQS